MTRVHRSILAVTGPGANDPFDPWDLDDARERIVIPVVTSMVQRTEIENIEIGWGPDFRPHPEPHLRTIAEDKIYDFGSDLYVMTSFYGPNLKWQIWQPHLRDAYRTIGEVAFAYAVRVEQFVTEKLDRRPRKAINIFIPARI